MSGHERGALTTKCDMFTLFLTNFGNGKSLDTTKR